VVLSENMPTAQGGRPCDDLTGGKATIMTEHEREPLA
jgi:hypothetical protein